MAAHTAIALYGLAGIVWAALSGWLHLRVNDDPDDTLRRCVTAAADDWREYAGALAGLALGIAIWPLGVAIDAGLLLGALAAGGCPWRR